MLRALTRAVSPNIGGCELTFRNRELIDYKRALRQHEEYCGLLSSLGVEVIKLEASDSHPDCCFIEDTAIVLDELAIITSMGTASRRGETSTVEKELAGYREIAYIRLPAAIEGGDVMQIGKKVFAGLSRRTNAQGIEALTQILKPLGYEVSPVRLEGCLHLKTACSAINDETILANPHWIDLNPFKAFNVLHTPEDEPWAANTLRIRDTACLGADTPRTIDLVRGLNDGIEVLDISEFRKAEGSLTCLSIIFQDLNS